MATTRELLDQRYGPAHDVPARDALNPVFETLRARCSVLVPAGCSTGRHAGVADRGGAVGAPPSWSQHVSERLCSPERLNGRHRLREALAALGFPLR